MEITHQGLNSVHDFSTRDAFARKALTAYLQDNDNNLPLWIKDTLEAHWDEIVEYDDIIPDLCMACESVGVLAEYCEVQNKDGNWTALYVVLDRDTIMRDYGWDDVEEHEAFNRAKEFVLERFKSYKAELIK